MVRAAVLLLLLGCGSVNAVGTPDAAAAMSDAAPGDAASIEGLVAWYRMDTLAERTASDATGHHDATCGVGTCPAVSGDGRIDGAYVFDGTDDLIRVPSTAELKTPQAFTVTAWINRDPGSTDACIVNKSFGADGNNSWQACIDEAGSLAFYSVSASGADTLATAAAVLDTARWYHLALWWNGTTKAIFIDGARTVAKDVPAISFDDADITIGSDVDAGALVGPFSGMVDDVRIYNRALLAAELTALQSP